MTFLKKIIVAILILESRLIVRKYKPFIVAVTGSVGKTSTKDAIYDVMKHQAGIHLRKSAKSFNSEIGLPLTVIGVQNAWHSMSGWMDNISAGLHLLTGRREYPDSLVLEIGADHPGDIKRIVKWLKPNITVLTRISRTPVHVEFFNSPEEVLEEKAALATAVRPGGSLVVYADDERVLAVGDRVKDKNVSVISYGVSEASLIKGSNVRTDYTDGAPTGMTFDINLDGTPTPVTVKGILGATYMYPLLAAAAVGRVREIDTTTIVRSLESYEPPRGRMNIIPGINGSTIIDDTYNSSPDAVVAALEVMKGLNATGNKYAVLGDMMELGKFASGEHRRVGQMANGCVNKLFTVGQRSRLTAEEAVKAGMKDIDVKSFDNSGEAATYITGMVKAGDIVLVKGSQSVRTERISAGALLREPAKAAKLLVRQEKEWLDKV